MYHILHGICCIITAIEQQPQSMREQVEEVSVDMWGGFPKVIKEVFPNAKVVISCRAFKLHILGGRDTHPTTV
ncbi:transposase [Microcoleus sp. N3A4]